MAELILGKGQWDLFLKECFGEEPDRIDLSDEDEKEEMQKE